MVNGGIAVSRPPVPFVPCVMMSLVLDWPAVTAMMQYLIFDKRRFLRQHKNCMIKNEAICLRLKCIASMSVGFPFRSRVEEEKGTGVRVVQMRDISLEHGVRWETCTEVEVSVKRESDWLREGDILFAARGNVPYAYPIVSLPSVYPMLASPHFFVIRIQANDILPSFVAWYLNQRPAQRYFAAGIEGTTTKSIRREVLEDAPIAIPPLSTQHVILHLQSSILRERHCLLRLIEIGQSTLTTVAERLVNGEVMERR